MKLNAVHHVALIVSDYDKSRDFYVNKLGFEIIREKHQIQLMLHHQNVLGNQNIIWKHVVFVI